MKHISVCISELFDSNKFKKYGDLEQRSKIYEVQAVVYKVLIDLKTSEKDSLLLCEYLKKIIEAKKGRSATLLLHEAYTIIYQVLHYLKYNKYLKDTQNVKAEYTRLMTLKDMLQDLTKEEVKDFFNNLMLEVKDTTKPNGVSLMTIHKSKGLEFNTVFIVGCNDGILPGFSRKNKDLEEDRRVFYVAMTRAKQNLFLYSSQIHFVNGQQFKLKPSQFLTEAGINNETEEFFGKYFYNK